MGLSQSSIARRDDALAPFGSITAAQTGQFLLVWASKLGYDRILLSHADFSLIFGREHETASQCFDLLNESGRVNALEMFCLLYLVGCKEMSADDKLDSIISLVQFQPLPHQHNRSSFSHNKPKPHCSSEELLTAVECVVLALSRATKTPPPLAMRCAKAVASLSPLVPSTSRAQTQAQAHTGVEGEGEEKVRERSQPWPLLRMRLCDCDDFSSYLELFCDVPSFSRLRRELAGGVERLVSLFRSRATALIHARGGVGGRHTRERHSLSLAPASAPAKSSENIFKPRPPANKAAPATPLRLSLSLRVDQSLDVLLSSEEHAWTEEERRQLHEALSRQVAASEQVPEDCFEILARASFSHSLLASAPASASPSASASVSASAPRAVEEKHLGTLVRLMQSHDDEALALLDVDAEVARLAPALLPLKASRQFVLPRSAWLCHTISHALARRFSESHSEAGADPALLALFKSLGGKDGLVPASKLSLLLQSRLSPQTKRLRSLLTPSSQALLDANIAFLVELLVQRVGGEATEGAGVSWTAFREHGGLLEDFVRRIDDYALSLKSSDALFS